MNKISENVLYRKVVFFYTFVFFCLLFLTGCQSLLSSDEQIQRFEQAGPITPKVDIDSLLKAKIHTGYYRVVSGDILELQMPAVLRVISPDLSKWFEPISGHYDIEPYSFRVNDSGSITLPIIGEISVAGMKLIEIESLIINAYYPKYVSNLPSVVCSVKEYQTENITVIGGVAQPGLYRLRSDEMSVVAALMKAGGIIEEGASLITIQHANPLGDIEHALREVTKKISSDSAVSLDDGHSSWSEQKELSGIAVPEVSSSDVERAGATMTSVSNYKVIVLPVKGLNIPFTDVGLLDGDVVKVEKLNPEVFTVLGPVESPGAFPYPPDIQYNLMQALAFAGGPDLVLAPRYVTIYRQDAKGRIVSATFGLDRNLLAKASTVKILPGDVISVEMTLGSQIRMILREMFFIRIGYDLEDTI